LSTSRLRISLVVNRNSSYYPLSGFYFFFFATLGIFLPYWGLYLKSLSFNAKEIGELMAVLMATKVIAPNIWGWLADRTGARLRIIRLTTFFAALAFSLLLWVTTYRGILAILVLYSFFWNAALPQFEATTMSHLGHETHRYSIVRLWGSIGFILSVSLFAPYFDHFGIQMLPFVVLVLLVALWMDTWLVVDNGIKPAATDCLPMTGTLKQPVVIALLLTSLLVQASHGPYYAFFSIYLEDYGYTKDLIGLLWALGVVAEIVVFLFMPRWLPLFGARKLLLTAVLLTSIRWFLIATQPHHLTVLLFAQILHAASFGVFHASAIHLVHRLFPGQYQGRGQALYSSLSFGLGVALGSLMSGYVWSVLGATWAYHLGAMLAALGYLVAWWGINVEPAVLDKDQRGGRAGLS
jgi:PPP family 3-phenylpropionic acid transporter